MIIVTKILKTLKDENVENDEIVNTVNEIGEQDRTIEDLKKQYPDKIIKLEEALLNYKGNIDLKNLKTEFPDNRWKYLTKKLAYPYEEFNSLDDSQKPVDNLKKVNLKNKYPSAEEKERTKEIKMFNIKNGE